MRYANLLTSGELSAYLADIDRQAEELFLRLVKQMADAEGITETLKASDQMEWVGRMNSCRDRATETVYIETAFEGETGALEGCSSLSTPAPPEQ